MTRRRRRKLVSHEKKVLARRVLRVTAILDQTLQEDFDGRRFYSNRLSDNDKLRLFQLWLWQKKYDVSIRWILNQLLPIYHKRFAKFARNQRGLGVRIPTLVGKKSEDILKEKIAEEFMDGENVSIARHERQQRIVSLRLDGDEDPSTEYVERRKDITDFRTPEAYAAYYARRIKASRKEISTVVNDKKNKLKPYRGNPWV